MTKKQAGFSDTTRAVIAGRHPEEHFGVVNPPVYHASTILFPTMEALEKRDQPYTYGRRGTPTLDALADAIAELEGAHKALLTPSGVSAIALALLAFVEAGDHILVVDSVYSPTRHFCDTMLKKLGVETTYYDPLIGAGITELFRGNTRLVFAESPGSMTFEMQDIPAISAAAHSRDIRVLMDNTWATPLFFKPFDHGVDVSIHSATKYLGGHSDVMMGAVTAARSAWREILRAHGALGLTSGPDDAYLVQRGLRTLPVRLKQHMENGIALAEWLRSRPEVADVLHPALPGSPGHDIWKRDFLGASGLFSIILKTADKKAVAALLDDLELYGMGYSWGGYESLALPQWPQTARSATNWAESGQLLRIHAGLEDIEDLKADLAAGFERLNAALS